MRTPPATWIAGYIALIAYVSLYPATDWRMPPSPSWGAFAPGGAASRSDLVSNVLAYIPLGALLYWRFRAQQSALAASAFSVLAGSLLSAMVEATQLFLPSRVASLGDLAMNASGTLIGALAAGFALRSLPPADYAAAGRRSHAGITGAGAVAIMLWVASQWSPFVPSLDWGTVRHGLGAVRAVLQDFGRFRWPDFAAYACNLLAVGLIAANLRQPHRPLVLPFLVAGGAVLGAKVGIVGRVLSLEALCGLCTAALALAVLRGLPRRPRDTVAAIALLAGFLVGELAPAPGSLHPFNWIPLAGAVDNNLNAFAELLGTLWPFFGLGYLAARLTRLYLRREVMVLGAMAVFAFGFAAEFAQQFIPGRHGDITVAGVAVIGWLASWRWRAQGVGDDYTPGVAKRPDPGFTRV